MEWGRILLAAAIIVFLPMAAQAQAVGVIISGRADLSAAIAAVIERIATDPGAVQAIVSAQVAATPDYSAAIATSVMAAYPGFAGIIAQAAGFTRPPPPPSPPPAPVFAPVAAVPPPPAVIPQGQAPRPASRPDPFNLPYVAALRLAVLAQDIDFIGTSFEDGQAINGEIQFIAPELLEIIFSPRPTLGGTVSTAGGTNTLYGGLNWHFTPYEPLFFDAFFGFSLHDGNATDFNTADNKTLGCELLFREALELGVEITANYTLSVMVSHLSHGEILCPNARNRSMDHLGVRLGYEF